MEQHFIHTLVKAGTDAGWSVNNKSSEKRYVFELSFGSKPASAVRVYIECFKDADTVFSYAVGGVMKKTKQVWYKGAEDSLRKFTARIKRIQKQISHDETVLFKQSGIRKILKDRVQEQIANRGLPTLTINIITYDGKNRVYFENDNGISAEYDVDNDTIKTDVFYKSVELTVEQFASILNTIA